MKQTRTTMLFLAAVVVALVMLLTGCSSMPAPTVNATDDPIIVCRDVAGSSGRAPQASDAGRICREVARR